MDISIELLIRDALHKTVAEQADIATGGLGSTRACAHGGTDIRIDLAMGRARMENPSGAPSTPPTSKTTARCAGLSADRVALLS